MTANPDKSKTTTSYVSFNVDRPVMVHIAHDAGKTELPDWISEYINRG